MPVSNLRNKMASSVPEVALAAGIDEDTQAAALAEEEVLEEGASDVINPDDSYSDVEVALKVKTALTDGTNGVISWDSPATATTLTGRITYAKISSGDTPIPYTLSADSYKVAPDNADSANPYQVYLYVEEGFAFAATPV